MKLPELEYPLLVSTTGIPVYWLAIHYDGTMSSCDEVVTKVFRYWASTQHLTTQHLTPEVRAFANRDTDTRVLDLLGRTVKPGQWVLYGGDPFCVIAVDEAEFMSTTGPVRVPSTAEGL